MITCIPGKVMSGKFSSRSSFAEISPTASTARNTMTVVTGRLSARLGVAHGEPQPVTRFRARRRPAGVPARA